MEKDKRDKTIDWLRDRAKEHRGGHPITRDAKAAKDCDEMADLVERRHGKRGT